MCQPPVLKPLMDPRIPTTYNINFMFFNIVTETFSKPFLSSLSFLHKGSSLFTLLIFLLMDLHSPGIPLAWKVPLDSWWSISTGTSFGRIYAILCRNNSLFRLVCFHCVLNILSIILKIIFIFEILQPTNYSAFFYRYVGGGRPTCTLVSTVMSETYSKDMLMFP